MKPAFCYRDGTLYADEIDCNQLAKDYGTPLYVYSRTALTDNWHYLNNALGDRKHLVCYAVKANSNLSVLDALARCGSGFDVVSIGELKRVLAAGGQADKVVYSSVGKRSDEIAQALDLGIHSFNVESDAELDLIQHIACARGRVAPVSMRINPDIDAKTHRHISTGLKEHKFGIPLADAPTLYHRASAMSHIKIIGIDCHIGSHVSEASVYLAVIEKLLELKAQLNSQGIEIAHLNIGGGYAIPHRPEEEMPLDLAHLFSQINQTIGTDPVEILIEPGRFIAGNAGILLTQVQYIKKTTEKQFVITDAGMNDLIRPALYDAWHNISLVQQQNGACHAALPSDIVGPVCESADIFARARALDAQAGDILAIHSAGAYGFSMSSNYNSRVRAAEVMVHGTDVHLARERETIEALFAKEHLLPEQQLGRHDNDPH